MALNFQDKGNAPRAGVLVVILLVISLLLVVLYGWEGSAGPLHRVQSACLNIASPISSVGNSVGDSAKGLSLAAQDATANPDTLSGLQEENEELRNQVSQLEEYRQEAIRLENLLNLRNTYSVDGTAARVVGRSGEAYSQTITLDAGSEDGVEVGQTVMGSNGVVGQIISVAAGSSIARLLSDPDSGCAAMIQSSRVEGVVRGSLSGLLYLEDVDSASTVSVGDTVITSGLGGSYISGLLVGTVVSVNVNKSGATRSIVVSQNENTGDQISEVIIVKSATAPTTVSANTSSTNTSSDSGSASSNTATGQ